MDATDIQAGQVGVDKLAGCWKYEYKLALGHNLATCIILDGERKSERNLEKKPRIRLGKCRIEVQQPKTKVEGVVVVLLVD